MASDRVAPELDELFNSKVSAERRLAGRRRVRRFSKTERWLHWSHAGAFTLMTLTGLVLYLPFLAQLISDRPVIKSIHLAVACFWLTALALVVLLGDRGVLRKTRRDFERFDSEDWKWLKRQPSRPGRFNAGQKLHGVVQAALTLLFFVSGTLLWLGERNTSLRFSGTIALHDVSMYVAVIFVLGHLYKAFAPETSAALEGVFDGNVPQSYATSHHPRWVPENDPPEHRPRLGAVRATAALALIFAGFFGAAYFVSDTLDGATSPGLSSSSSEPSSPATDSTTLGSSGAPLGAPLPTPAPVIGP